MRTVEYRENEKNTLSHAHKIGYFLAFSNRQSYPTVLIETESGNIVERIFNEIKFLPEPCANADKETCQKVNIETHKLRNYAHGVLDMDIGTPNGLISYYEWLEEIICNGEELNKVIESIKN